MDYELIEKYENEWIACKLFKCRLMVQRLKEIKKELLADIRREEEETGEHVKVVFEPGSYWEELKVEYIEIQKNLEACKKELEPVLSIGESYNPAALGFVKRYYFEAEDRAEIQRSSGYSKNQYDKMWRSVMSKIGDLYESRAEQSRQ